MPAVNQEERRRHTGYHSSHWRQLEGLQLGCLCLHVDRFRPGLDMTDLSHGREDDSKAQVEFALTMVKDNTH